MSIRIEKVTHTFRIITFLFDHKSPQVDFVLHKQPTYDFVKQHLTTWMKNVCLISVFVSRV